MLIKCIRLIGKKKLIIGFNLNILRKKKKNVYTSLKISIITSKENDTFEGYKHCFVYQRVYQRNNIH